MASANLSMATEWLRDCSGMYLSMVYGPDLIRQQASQILRLVDIAPV